MSKHSRRKPGEIRRREILSAARDLFYEHGFDQVGMEDVAKSVGITKAAVYFYYKSKLELFIAMVKSSLDQLVSDLKAALKDESKKGVKNRLDAVLHSLGRHVPLISSMRRLFETGGTSVVPARHMMLFTKRITPGIEEVKEVLTSVFFKAQKAGEVRKNLTPQTLANAFLGLASSLAKAELEFAALREIFLEGILVKETG
jgi:AcrR family transcriptional regulator